MPPQPPSAAPRDEPVIRDRGDACPGALRLHAADDGFLARVRVPGGMLGADAALLLADAADRLGDGHVDLTSRGNAQLRGLGASCGGALQSVLVRAGLLPAPTHERVRNIVASPLTGLDRRGLPDVAPWVAELDRLLCAEPAAAALSGRFLFALDDGRGDARSLAADVTVLARGADRALLLLGGTPAERTAGAPGAGAPDTGSEPAGQRPVRAVLVASADAPRAALTAALYFLDAARAAGTRAWRIAELPAEHALTAAGLTDRLAAVGIAAEAGAPPAPAAADSASPYGPDGRAPGPGTVTGPDGTVALSVLAPLGRLTTAQWRLLAGLTGRIRLTPWRGIVVPGLPAHAAARELAALAEAGLVTASDDPWRSVTACTGRPGCAKSLADVRADARAAVTRATGPLPVHWSGCERRCGHPRGTAWVDLVATPEGYDLSAPGRTPRRGLQTSELPAALADARRTTSHDAAKK
ncbi:precorrin-3B synthase [Streptomyces sp. NPDC057686]|uniref:precorrin-3B synthase n=1 Tax=Streptomyces sp. NPDC057686 TaxID=3346212 RepID=UPI00367B18F6